MYYNNIFLKLLESTSENFAVIDIIEKSAARKFAEHMVVDAGKDYGFKIGDLLYALPIRICPTVALYSHADCIESGKIADDW